MHPYSRFAVSLVLALTIWSPMGLNVVRGRTDTARALIGYVLAYVIARICVGGFDRLVRGYRASMAAAADAAAPDPDPDVVDAEIDEGRPTRRPADAGNPAMS